MPGLFFAKFNVEFNGEISFSPFDHGSARFEKKRAQLFFLSFPKRGGKDKRAIFICFRPHER